MKSSIEEIKRIYDSWDMDSEPSDDLQQWIAQSRLDSNNQSTFDFARHVIDNFSIEKGFFWVDWAIKYMWRSKNRGISVDYLEKIISNYGKYKDLSVVRSSAASYLGDISTYPNQVLKSAISFEDNEDVSDWNQEAIRQFRAAAFGGYVMTATDFQTGMDAGRAIKASGETPTVEKAEQIIAEWRKEHGSSSP